MVVARTLEGSTRPAPARVAAISATLVLHVVGFGLLIAPITRPIEELPRLVEPDRPMVVTIEKPRTLLPVPPMPVPPEIRVRTRPQPIVAPAPTPIVRDATIAAPPLPQVMPDVIGEPTIDAPADVPFDGTPVAAGEPGIVSGVPPKYSRVAIRARMQGTVTLEILIDESGRPERVEVAKSSGHRELDRLAREAVQKYRFRAATKGGVAVKSIGTLPVVFTLGGG